MIFHDYSSRVNYSEVISIGLSVRTNVLTTVTLRFQMKPRNETENLTPRSVRREAATGTGKYATTLAVVPPPAHHLRTTVGDPELYPLGEIKLQVR